MVIGKNIIYLRRKTNLTQEELATKISVSRQAVSKWENGEVVPDSLNLIELSKVFDVKVDDLLLKDLESIMSIESIEEPKVEPTIIKSKCKLNVPLLIGCTFLIIILLAYLNRDSLFPVKENNEIDEEIIEEAFEIDYSKLISAGREFSVYIDNSGKVNGYGDNTYKQLNFDNWSDIIQVAAGGFHTLGLKSDGSVLATGYNNLGQIDVSNWNDIKQISAGRYHSLGLKSDGSVVCVGENEYGQCNLSNWSNIIQISAGRYNSYGLKNDGSVVSTSDNEYGQANISTWTDIKQISSGTYQVLGLMNDGTVVCAGGQKSDGACNVSSWADIKQVVGAGYHSIGLKNDGTVVATGSNEYGQTNTSSWANIEAVAGGRYHTLGINSSGVLIAVGSNDENQISFNSNNSNNQTDTTKPTPPVDNKDKENYIITFNTNEGSEIAEMKLERGSEFVAPNSPTRSGYIFAGWYSDKELNTYFEFPKKIESDMVLYADWGTEGLDYTKLSNGTYSVSSNLSNILNVRIPNRYNKLLVTEIANQGFANSKINKIILSQSIKRIGSSAFKGTNIQEIFITKNIEQIGDFAFEGLTLETIAFETGSKIKTLTGLNSIKRLKNIILPDGVEVIGEGAFRSTRIDNIKVSDSVTTIKRYAFSNECNKESVYNSELCNGNSYGYESDFISKIEFSANSLLKSIEKEAFSNSDFKTFILPKKLESIGEKAFYNNYMLEKLYLPKSLINVASDSFSYSYPLLQIQNGTDTSKWGEGWDIMINYNKQVLKFNIEWID